MNISLNDFLSKELRMSERELRMLIATAPNRYKTYFIPKRTGGVREIAQPAIELKMAQRAIMERYLKSLPVHFCATAYKAGSSIRKNAERHAHNRPILKYDFRDFFPSITERAWIAYCEQHDVFDHDDAVRSARLLFRRPKGSRILRLSIGAPSSPMLSNILLNDFDREIYDRVSDHKITYTRYADDMTFSSERTWNLKVVDGIIRSVIYNLKHPKLSINEKKTIFVTPKFHRQVTGITLTLDGRISIGRERKRNIRAEIHHYVNGNLDIKQKAKLSGSLAFAKDVEPEFYTRMERVYGKDVIERLKVELIGYRREKNNK